MIHVHNLVIIDNNNNTVSITLVFTTLLKVVSFGLDYGLPWGAAKRRNLRSRDLGNLFSFQQLPVLDIVWQAIWLDLQLATLKEKLSVAEKEIKKMSELIEGISLNNPSATIPTDMDTVDSPFTLDPFAGNLGWFDYEDLLYLLQQNYISAAEWLLLHTY